MILKACLSAVEGLSNMSSKIKEDEKKKNKKRLKNAKSPLMKKKPTTMLQTPYPSKALNLQTMMKNRKKRTTLATIRKKRMKILIYINSRKRVLCP